MRWPRAFLVIVLVAGMLAGTSTPVAADHCSTLVTKLSGSAIGGIVPSGKGNWRGNDLCNLGLELKVELSNINLPDGTNVTFTSWVDETTGRTFQRDLTLSKGSARLELKRSNGDSVPRCDRGTTVQIVHGGSTILSGIWCAPVVTRCD